MDRSQALALLDLPPSATPADIKYRHEERRAAVEDRILTAPTAALKSKYRSQLNEFELAWEVLTARSAEASAEGIEELPAARKSTYTDTSGELEAQVSQAGAGHVRPPPTPPANGVRMPPVRPVRPAPEPPGGKPPLTAPVPLGGRSPRTPPRAPGRDAPDEAEPKPLAARLPRPAWHKWAGAGVLALLAAGGFVWWYLASYLPEKAEERRLDSVAQLGSAQTEAGRIDSLEGKCTAMAWTAAALAAAGDKQSASVLRQQASAALAELEKKAELDHQKPAVKCRLAVVDAALGDMAGAGAALKPVAATPGAAPSHLLAWEAKAAGGIARWLARQGKYREALTAADTLQGAANTSDACSALAFILARLEAGGDKRQALAVAGKLLDRASLAPEPDVKARYSSTALQAMARSGGKAKVKSLAASVANTRSSGREDGGAAKAVALAQAHGVALLSATGDKNTAKQRLGEARSAASNLALQQDVAEAMAQLAQAAHALDEKSSAELLQAAKDASAHVGSAPAALLGGEAAVTAGTPAASASRQRDLALAAVVVAAARTGRFAQAIEWYGQMQTDEGRTRAAEELTNALALAGRAPDAEPIIAAISDPGGRCRAWIALSAGTRGELPDPWW